MKTKSADTKRVKERHGGLLRPETGKREASHAKRMTTDGSNERFRGAGQLVRVAVPALYILRQHHHLLVFIIDRQCIWSGH